MPPMGVSSPAPSTMRICPALDTKMPPGTARPSTAAPNAMVPSRFSVGGPQAADRAAGRRGIPLDDDLLQAPARGEHERLEGLAATPHRREERDIALRVD